MYKTYKKVRKEDEDIKKKIKVACTVWSGGKFYDYFKELPITIQLLNVKDCENI